MKDLLRVGSWPIGVGADGTVQKWDVSEATLGEIEQVFARQKSEGQTRPLQWVHADLSGGSANVDARDVVDYWDTTFVEDGTLWGVIYVTDQDAETLTKVDRPISVAVDYLGSLLTPGTVTPVKNALIHVALVDQGAMPGQGPFVQMAAPQGTPSMDFAALVEAINKLLNAVKPGSSLPESVTEENLVTMLDMAVSMLTGEAKKEEGEGEEAKVGPEDPLVAPEMAQMQAKIAQLSASLQLLTGKQEADKKAAFETYVDGLCSGGLPASARDSLINVGKHNGWDTASISGLPGVDAALVQMGSRITSHTPATKKDVAIKTKTDEFISAGFPAARARKMAENVVARSA